MNLFITSLWSDPAYFWGMTVLVLFSVSLHEFVHARTALALGDPTAAERGHLTLNPFKQMGGFSIIMFLMVGICYGAVPVNPARLRGKYGELTVSLAGPATNLVLALLFYISVLAAIRGGAEILMRFFFMGMSLNLILFCFNMLPVPPLDGFSIVRTFVPMRTLDPEWVRGAMLAVFVLVFMSFGRVSGWIISLGGRAVKAGAVWLGFGG